MFKHDVHVQHASPVAACIDIMLMKNIVLDFTVTLLYFGYNFVYIVYFKLW